MRAGLGVIPQKAPCEIAAFPAPFRGLGDLVTLFPASASSHPSLWRFRHQRYPTTRQARVVACDLVAAFALAVGLSGFLKANGSNSFGQQAGVVVHGLFIDDGAGRVELGLSFSHQVRWQLGQPPS